MCSLDHGSVGWVVDRRCAQAAGAAPSGEDGASIVVGAGDAVEVGAGWSAALCEFAFVVDPHQVLGGWLAVSAVLPVGCGGSVANSALGYLNPHLAGRLGGLGRGVSARVQE